MAMEKPKTNELLSYFMLGATKIAEERAMMPIIGNNTLQSGAIKTGVGLAIAQMGGKNAIAKTLAMAFVIDGMEDLANNVMAGIPALNSSASAKVLTV